MKTLATFLLALLLASCAGDRFARAQTPNPVTPGYQICSTADAGNTHCSFQPVDLNHGLPVQDGAGADTTGTLAGSGAGSVIAPIDGYASAKIQIKGTYAAFTVSVNASSDGGVTLTPLQCAMVDGSQFGVSFILQANQSAEISCGHQSGDDTLVLSTAAGPATGSAAVAVSPASFPSMDGSTVALGAYLYKNITTDATTVVKTGAGYLHTVCVNTPAATETVTMFDNTTASGTKIGTITLFASTNPCFVYDVGFSAGLTIVTGVAAGDITVSYR